MKERLGPPVRMHTQRGMALHCVVWRCVAWCCKVGGCACSCSSRPARGDPWQYKHGCGSTSMVARRHVYLMHSGP